MDECIPKELVGVAMFLLSDREGCEVYVVCSVVCLSRHGLVFTVTAFQAISGEESLPGLCELREPGTPSDKTLHSSSGVPA